MGIVFDETEQTKIYYDVEEEHFVKVVGHRDNEDEETRTTVSDTLDNTGALALRTVIHYPKQLMEFLCEWLMPARTMGVAARVFLGLSDEEIVSAEIGEMDIINLESGEYRNLRSILLDEEEPKVKNILLEEEFDSGEYRLCCRFRNGYLVSNREVENRLVVSAPELWILLKKAIREGIDFGYSLDEIMDSPVANFPNQEFADVDEFAKHVRKLLIALRCEAIGVSLKVFDE